MDMKRRWGSVAAVILAVTAVAGYVLAQRATVTPVTATAAPPHAPAPSADEVNYPSGSEQLSMIRAQDLPAVAMPVGEALGARVVYDEDVTARVGVGVAGRVVAIKAAPGDAIRAGQVLAEIDSADFGSALADLHKATADEERKRQVLERARELVPGEAIAGKDWESAQADYAQARAETVRATRRVDNLNPAGGQVRGQRMNVASPVAGVVAERNVTPALEVGPGMSAPLFVLTDPKRLWLLIDVPETMLSRVTLGGAVDVESDAFPGEHFQAAVSQLGLAVDPNTRRVVVRARLDNRSGKLLPEMYVRAALLQAQGRAVKVPNGALVNRGLYTYLFVQSAPGRFQRRQVRMLTHGDDASYVADGVRGGERIVTAGALLLDADMSARAGGAP